MKTAIILFFALLFISCTPKSPIDQSISEWIEINASDPDSWEPISTEVKQEFNLATGDKALAIDHQCRVNKEKITYYFIVSEKGDEVLFASQDMRAAGLWQIENR